MSAEDPRRRQPPPAEEMDLFYRAVPLASPLDPLHEEDGQDQQELELGLSLGGHPRCKGGTRDDETRGTAKGWDDRCRILTAGDFPTPGRSPAAPAITPPPPASSSPTASTSSVSSSSSSLAAAGRPGAAGTKRHAEAAAPEPRSSPPGSQAVVGWPPIRAYRVNSLVNHLPKDNTPKENPSARYGNTHGQGADGHLGCSSNSASAQENSTAAAKEPEKKRTSAHLVKVNMDGMAIGRKVDLTAHSSYNALALVLEDMFQNTRNPSQTKKTSKLLDGSSEFVLTYEDKDGDWMLVGDVPWGMFLNSVRRLRIMRTCDANVLAPGVHPNTNGLRSIHR